MTHRQHAICVSGALERADGEREEVARLVQLAHAAGVRRVMVIMAPVPVGEATDHEVLSPAVCQALEVALRLLASGQDSVTTPLG